MAQAQVVGMQAPSSTAPGNTLPTEISVALRECSEMLDEVQEHVDEGTYLKICNVVMKMQNARRADILRSAPTVTVADGGAAAAAGTHMQNLRTLHGMVNEMANDHESLREENDALHTANQELRTENDEYQAQLQAATLRIDAWEDRFPALEASHSFYLTSTAALKGVIAEAGIPHSQVLAAFKRAGILEQHLERETRKRKREDVENGVLISELDDGSASDDDE